MTATLETVVPTACALRRTNAPADAVTSPDVKTEALAEMKVRVPPAFCANAKVPVVPTVQVPIQNNLANEINEKFREANVELNLLREQLNKSEKQFQLIISHK